MTYRAWNTKTVDRAALKELTAAIAQQNTEELEYQNMDEEWSEEKYRSVLAAQQKEAGLLAGILAARGITDPAEALTLLAGEEELSDPMLLTDMDKACERILRAIDEGETIVVFGDYDVDGVTATALLYQHLKGMGAAVKCMLPSREGDGYGLSKNAIQSIYDKGCVGTDLLRGVITSIRKEIESLGGEVHFNTALTGFERRDGQLVGIQTTDGAFPCEALVFAVGHSARDTFGMLMDSGLVLECKPFSVGFRAEHLQSEIEKSLYHEAAGHPALPRGEYQLSQHVEKRCVYTFCMCPGGQVVASASEKGRVVTNGMSYHARSGRNANAAVVVSVGGEDFGNDPRKAIAFQRELEARAYAAGRPGGEYAAPAENIQSFLEGRGRLNIGRVQPTYDRGVVAADLGALLPTELADTLRAGLRAYERKIAGYTAPEAILTGLETRTSSPVRLKREENFECAQLAGLYPCGEGAGYAGGIMSAAVDGLRVARAIISRYSPAEG